MEDRRHQRRHGAGEGHFCRLARLEPDEPAIFAGDLESLLGRAREQLQFTMWFLQQKKFVTRDDNSRLLITADGVEFLEQNYRTKGLRRLQARTESTA